MLDGRMARPPTKVRRRIEVDDGETSTVIGLSTLHTGITEDTHR
jgi:hypothetical protein